MRVLGGVASGVRGKLTVECEISRWTDMRNAGLSDDMIEVDELVDFQRNEEGCDNDYLRLGKVIELMGRWHLKGEHKQGFAMGRPSPVSIYTFLTGSLARQGSNLIISTVDLQFSLDCRGS